MILVLLFLPGTWIIYGICRFGLSYLNIPNEDRIAMSVLAALVYLFTTLLRTWTVWNNSQSAQSTEKSK